MDKEENKYHFAREILFTLRSCKAISGDVYLHWVDKLIKEEKQQKSLPIESGRVSFPLAEIDKDVFDMCKDEYDNGDKAEAVKTILSEASVKNYKFGISQAKKWLEV